MRQTDEKDQIKTVRLLLFAMLNYSPFEAALPLVVSARLHISTR